MNRFLKNLKLHFRVGGLNGAYAFLSQLFTKKEASFISKRYTKFPITLRSNTSDVFLVNNIFKKGEYKFDSENRDIKVIIDAGANIGLASIYLSEKFPNAKIISIEPESNNFESLKKNTALYKNIFPIEAALWDKIETLKLSNPSNDHWGFIAKRDETGKRAKTVRTTTLNCLIDEHQLDRIDILKLDIEGAEREVLKDSQDWIDQVELIIVELHEQESPGCTKVLENAALKFKRKWIIGENIYLSR